MRPLPRLHAVTDARILGRDDLTDLAARLAASVGPALALHVRDRALPARTLLARALELGRIAAPEESALFVNARADVAAAAGAHGRAPGPGRPPRREARRVLGPAWNGWVGLSVHSAEEADAAVADGADYLMLGNIYPTSSHPGRPALGLGVLRQVAQAGRPVIAIGGVTPERAGEVRAAGAWGIAAITRALGRAPIRRPPRRRCSSPGPTAA